MAPSYDVLVLEMIDRWAADHAVPGGRGGDGSRGLRERRYAGAPAGQPVRLGLADQTSGRRRLYGRRRARGRSTWNYRWPAPGGLSARPSAGITARHLLSHASGLPEVGPPGVASLDVDPVAPPGIRRIYSNEGYAVLGELLSAATGISFGRYVPESVFAPLGMDAYLGLPESEYGRALDVREPGLSRPGVALFNSRQWRQRGTAAGGAFATLEAYAPFVAMLLRRGDPLLAPKLFDEMAAVQFPGIAGGIESFQTWEVADWSLGCDVRDHKGRTGRAAAPRPRRSPTSARRGRSSWPTYEAGRGPGRPGQPRHLLGLADAAGPLAGPVQFCSTSGFCDPRIAVFVRKT